jgi:hypothetical protein
MKTYGGVGVQTHAFLTSALATGEWSASRPGRFTIRKEPPVLIGQEAGWTPKPVWGTWRGENSCLHQDSNSDPSIVQPVASRYTDCAILTSMSVIGLFSCVISSCLHNSILIEIILLKRVLSDSRIGSGYTTVLPTTAHETIELHSNEVHSLEILNRAVTLGMPGHRLSRLQLSCHFPQSLSEMPEKYLNYVSSNPFQRIYLPTFHAVTRTG